MRSQLMAIAALLVLAGLSGCNTIRGVGEDISALGRSLSNATGTPSSTH